MLPINFRYNRFGLECSLITENDAPFIVSLRSDPALTKYMLTLKPDIELQKAWIRAYKLRESKGQDYYFVYKDENDRPVGINRISHIDYEKKEAKASSLITIKNKFHYGLKTTVIRYLIAFDLLDLETILLDIHQENERAINLYKQLGGMFAATESDYLDVSLGRNSFRLNYEKEDLQRLLAE